MAPCRGNAPALETALAVLIFGSTCFGDPGSPGALDGCDRLMMAIMFDGSRPGTFRTVGSDAACEGSECWGGLSPFSACFAPSKESMADSSRSSPRQTSLM